MLWEKFDEFVPGTNFVGWAIRIAKNKAMHLQRSRKRLSKFLHSDVQASLAVVVAGRDAAATSAPRWPP